MKVLIISLYGPPANNIAADRIGGYLNNLPDNQTTVVLVTRYFNASHYNDQNMLIGSLDAGMQEDYVQQGNIYYTNFSAQNRYKKTAAKLPPGIRGLYNLLKVDIYHAGWIPYVMKTLDLLMKKEKADHIVLSYGPPVVLPLAKQIFVKYGVKCVLEFRDSYIQEKDSGILLRIKKYNLNRYSQYCKAFVFASKGIQDYFLKYTRKKNISQPMFVLPHGFNPATMEEAKKEIIQADEVGERFLAFKKKFKVVAIFPGTLYGGQNLEFFIETMRTINAQNENTIGICLLGTFFDNRPVIPETGDLLLLPKVSKTKAISLMGISDILLIPVWKNRYSGTMGKLSEYCALQKPMAVSPDPQNDLRDFLAGNPNAYFSDSENDFIKLVREIAAGEVVGKTVDREKYSRVQHFRELSVFLRTLQ